MGNRNTKTKIAAMAVFVMAWFSMLAQQPQDFEVISTEQGLSQGMVFAIMQDREGFLWIATKDGLNRYDGYHFRVFTNDPYDPWSLSNNHVRLITEDSKGRIWASMDNSGVNVYNKKTGRFHRIQHDADDLGSLSSNRVKFIREAPDGKMLVVTDNAGLDVLDVPVDFFEKNTPPRVTRMGFPDTNTTIRSLGIDKKGRIWINGFNRSLYRFETVGNRFTKVADGIDFIPGHANDDGSIWCNPGPYLWDGQSAFPLFDQPLEVYGGLDMHPDGTMWIITDKGLKSCDISKWKPDHPLPLPKPWMFDSPTPDLQTYAIDKAGNLWVGTSGYGLRKMNLDRSKFRHEAAGFSVRFLLPLSNTDFFLGAYPVEWWRLNNGKLDKKPTSWLEPETAVDGMLVSRSGEYYLWTNKGLKRYNPANRSLSHLPAIPDYGDKQPMYEDRRGNIWFAGFSGALSRLNPANGKVTTFNYKAPGGSVLANLYSTAFYEDREGTFWIGTEDGFVRARPKDGDPGAFDFAWFRNNPEDRNSLNYNHVSCFLDDPADPGRYLWICTKGGGLNRLDKKNGDFSHWTAENSGLPNNVVYGLLPDEAGNLWGSTNQGLFCATPAPHQKNEPSDHSPDNKKVTGRGYVFLNFTKKDGLQDNEFNTGAFAKLPDGTLAFGGVNGLNIFDPKEILVEGFEPKVFITNILVNNKPVLPGDGSGVLTNTIETSKSITLKHKQDILTLEFASLDFTNPGQNKYRYQLVGVDDAWVELGNRRAATFLHLPPGNYTFRLQGSNSRGMWSEHIASLDINNLPPWWRSWWAYLGYLVLLAAGVREYFRFSINRAKLKQQLAYETREAERVKELDALKTELYTNITHEFRTPLTVILGMAKQALDNPADHFRSGLEMIIRSGQSLLKLVNEMLDLSKLESGKMTLHMVQGDVISFLRYLVEAFHSLAESQRKNLYFRSDTDSFHMDFDPEKLRQIVSNLLSNALKFTPSGGDIYLTVGQQSLAGDSTKLVIIVKDTGIGIPEAHLDSVFDRFYQVEGGETLHVGGSGIGLALTRELVKHMGGEIMVKSPPDGAKNGSEFTVALPVKRSAEISMVVDEYAGTSYFGSLSGLPASDRSLSLSPNHSFSSALPLILLVEDNPDVVAYTASCLPDYRLLVAKNGQEGLDLAIETIPDLILSDVMMPLMNGIELCRRLKADHRTSHIPIVMLTAKADLESKLEGLEQGADAYLAKPFYKNELLVRIRKLLDLRQQLQKFYLGTAGLSEIAAPAKVQLATEKVEDAFVKKVRELVEMHLTDVNFSVEKLCREVHLSQSQLQRKLDALTGCAPNRFIRIIRLAKAKELLKYEDFTIAEVAFNCGFNDPGYFSRAFKLEFGMTAAEYREQQRLGDSP